MFKYRFIKLINEVIALFFPPICLACKGPVAGEEAFICISCQSNLPFTNQHLRNENEIDQRFWGRIKIENMTSFLHFKKGGPVQNLLHFLKYENREDLGDYLGHWYGRELKESEIFKHIDMIIPVPIHKRRLKKRGYNQVALFSKNIATHLGKEYRDDLLIRISNSRSQIGRSKEERYEHLEKAFRWTNIHPMLGKHILLIDDLLTTGSTLEACCRPLSINPNIKISICTIAIAE